MKIRNFSLKNGTIKAHLLVIFLTLLVISTILITRITYEGYYKDVVKLSHLMISKASELLSEKMEKIRNEVGLVAKIIKGSIFNQTEVIGDDLNYNHFLINILENDPFLSAITMATPEGDYLSIMNVAIEQQKNFYFHPLEKLPEETKFRIRILKGSGTASKEIWNYIDSEGKVLATESSSPASYDFSKDPWLLSMMKNPDLSWRNELLPRGVDPQKQKQLFGLTLSDAVKTAKGEILAFFSVVVTFKNVSDFIANQPIGKNGSAFVINTSGNIEVPLPYGNTVLERERQELVSKGYAICEKKKQNNITLEDKGKKYLFSIKEAVLFADEKWFIAVVFPFDDLFGLIQETEVKTRLMSCFIGLLCAIAVYYSAKYFSKPIVTLANEVDRIRSFDFKEKIHLVSHIKEICDLEFSIKTMRLTLRSFSRYVPEEIVRSLVKYGNDVHLGGERSEITIMFSDIKDFTTISESLPIEKLMTELSSYFDVFSKIVVRMEGTIDKYIGDSLMAFWGAPKKVEDEAEKACLTCLHCLAAIHAEHKWETRFGIHSGEVIVGNIGTAERINYTVIGDAVNIASRLEEINKAYHTSIIISEVVYEKIGPTFVTRPLDFVAVKGKRNKLRIFELMGTTFGAFRAKEDQIELSRLFTKAYHLFEEGDLEKAKEAFLEIEKKFPLDEPTRKYLNRLNSQNS